MLNLQRHQSDMELLSGKVPLNAEMEFAGLLHGLTMEVMKCSLLGVEFLSNSNILQC